VPTFDPTTRLRNHVGGMIGRQCSAADFTEVMRLSRLSIETENLSGSYPHLALFCDWLLHAEIDRHGLVLNLIEQIHSAAANYDKTGNIGEVSRLLNLAALRAEMLVIFSSHQIRTDLLDSYANWNVFIGTILNDLCERPLRLPKKPHGKTKKAVDSAIARMKAKWDPKTPMWGRAFYLTIDHKKNPASLSWILECAAPFLTGADKLNISSSLQMTETAKDFSRP
jgi:hypothetical protein